MGDNWAEFQFMCRQCMGTGLVTPPYTISDPPPEQIECSACSGEGYEEWGRVKIKAITDALDDLTAPPAAPQDAPLRATAKKKK